MLNFLNEWSMLEKTYENVENKTSQMFDKT